MHLVGLSLGGGVGQQIAIRHGHLLASLTLMSTSPGGPGGGADLSPPTPAMQESLSTQDAPPDWTDPVQVEGYFFAAEQLFSGTIPVDEVRIRAIARSVFDRSSSLPSADNHWMAGADESAATREELADIRVPTLVIHGTADPLFPLDHGEALAREIPGASLVRVEGMGHQNPPPPTWDQIVAEIVKHTSR